MYIEQAIQRDIHTKTFGFSLGRAALTTARTLFGLVFLLCGLNGFFNFLPQPTGPMPEGAVAFGAALLQTGYMFPLIKGTEVAAGLLLIANRFVPLALVVLAPVMVNIFAFHLFLTPGELGLAAVLLVVQIGLALAYRAAYRPLFVARSLPAWR